MSIWNRPGRVGALQSWGCALARRGICVFPRLNVAFPLRRAFFHRNVKLLQKRDSAHPHQYRSETIPPRNLHPLVDEFVRRNDALAFAHVAAYNKAFAPAARDVWQALEASGAYAAQVGRRD